MRKACFILLLILLQIPAVMVPAEESQQPYTFRVGVTDPQALRVPVLTFVDIRELATFETTTPARTTVIVRYALGPEADPLLEVERETKAIIEWAAVRGPFEALGVDLSNASPEIASYAVRRLAVAAQGLGAAPAIVIDATRASDPSRRRLAELFDRGTNAYFDAVLVDAEDVADVYLWLAERDPSKQLFALVPASSPNTLHDLAAAGARGARHAYLQAEVSPETAAALSHFNSAMAGDWAHDSTSDVLVLNAAGQNVSMPVIAFVRGEDLRTILVPRAAAGAPSIISVPADRLSRPRLVGPQTEREIADTGQRGGRLLIGTPAPSGPFAIALDYVELPEASVTRETIDIATQRGISVEEIIRNHQSYEAWQDSVEPRFIARNVTTLRFDIGGGAESLEASIAGDFFSDPSGRADWVWEEFFINGVRWKYGRIPELPLIQPEKVTQLPLDINLSNEYRYTLVRQTNVAGYPVYEVRFEPPPNAPAELPLYRGTVWIDSRSWARVRISMVQLNLTGEILSNEERVDFAPFSRETRRPLSAEESRNADPRSLLWLPVEVNAQQVISAAGRATAIQRATRFDSFRINPEEYDALLARVSASDARMVRETPAGLRYLERRGDERVVKEGFDTARLFMLGGIHHDDGLEFPVIPLGGINYFNFNLANTGIQTNVFFAGVVLAANATHPNVAGTRTNLGADLFALAIPVSNSMYRDDVEQPEEAVKALPLGLFLRAGHPIFQFGKVDVSFGAAYQNYQRAEETGENFIVPSDTFTFTPGIEFRYARRGYSFSASYDYNRRSTWEPWGDLTEYDASQRSFSRFGASLGKSFYLPKFQRLGVDVGYMDGQRLDRFSKYELGFFGSKRVHGVRSGSVRAERGLIGHLSYGFVFSEQFRLELFYDHAVLDDRSAQIRREPFQGIGIAGQTIGPYGTLLRLDIGKMVGRNAQDGFVANVVFLKLF
jgi:hypothetical protein